ncbi:hypothetical protein [Vulgatibacter incomptus]|uniref:Uncharacterized protein n=1 Tax=Vulgatibacter incomptus TaxID=1391653 RepID=A0A0K1PFJ6_9BACT|nr:hypothetical protein [Vulgatibacter incomptus]AKU91884.1 hypothetical protein AKJ08_2271 [Vulgatibacter incomptus]
MIRVVTLDGFQDGDVDALCKLLFQAFNLGAELAGELPLPEEARRQDGTYDAALLLDEAETVKLVADDKLLYVTHSSLFQPSGPVGTPPTHGFAQFGGQRAVVTTSLFPKVLEEGSDEFRKRLAKQAVHEMGALWELHSCIDPKCSMHPPWTEGFAANHEPVLCTFCREKSEERIRMAKT